MDIVIRKKYCCKYPGCNNWYYSKAPPGFANKHFFKFPKDPHRHQLWKDICKIDRSQNSKFWNLCEDRFVDSDFVNVRKERLNVGAVPINVPFESDFVTLQDLSFCETTSEINSNNCRCSQASTSSHVCRSLFFSSQDEVTSNSGENYIQDHNYCKTPNDEIPGSMTKFNFLTNENGILAKIGLKQNELTPRKKFMYNIHRNNKSKLCKLTKLLEKSRNEIKILENKLQAGKFEHINENLNFVTKEFINSQLRNSNRKPQARTWSEQDKVFSLSLYKKSPRLYKYLRTYFQLPSARTLKAILAKIPFDTAVNVALLENLRSRVNKMKNFNRYCSLLFDEISLCEGFHYERFKQYISGFEDLGSLGRANKAANHALVFMIRGVRKQWKQVIAYYFTASTISADNLQVLIKEIILQLQDVGLNVVSTVCDQGRTNCSALRQLCAKKHPQQSPYYFFVNEQPVVVIYDVPHLLKNTRNALLKCQIQFDVHKLAKFHYIETVFNFDQQKTFKSLPKLKKEYFHLLKTNSYMKMKVKVAAAQLSSSVASAIETFTTIASILPAEAIFTAEFFQKIDNLFDSLNGCSRKPVDHKRFCCAVSHDSPHLEFWKKLLTEMDQWKLIDLETNTDVSNHYSFVWGWQTTIKSIIFLWNKLKNVDGFDYLSTRSFNQDPLENLFSGIRQHGAANTNPTCHQFTAALKTVVVNKLVSPTNVDGNCETDTCTPLEDLSSLINFSVQNSSAVSLVQSDYLIDFNIPAFDELPVEDSQALAYVAGWVLKSTKIPDCANCRFALFSESPTSRHLLTTFREYDNVQRLTYASDNLIAFVQKVHDCLYQFLYQWGFEKNLEYNFKKLFSDNVDFEQMCHDHNPYLLILDKCTTFFIYKFCKDKHKQSKSDGPPKRKKRKKGI